MHVKNPVGDFSPTGFVEQPFSYVARTVEGSKMNLMSKMLQEKSFFSSINLFVRVLLYNENVVLINVHKTQFFVYILVKIS